MVALVKNLRNFKTEYLILKGLCLKSSKNDLKMLLKINAQTLIKIDPQALLKIGPQSLLKIDPQSLMQKMQNPYLLMTFYIKN